MESKYKGCLEFFPDEIVEKMLEYQQEHSGIRDVKVFEQSLNAGAGNGGFKWSETKEGHSFWRSVLWEKDFELFFNKFPKKEGKMDETSCLSTKEKIDFIGKLIFLVETSPMIFNECKTLVSMAERMGLLKD